MPYMSLYIVNVLQSLEKFLIMISPKQSITSSIEANVIEITYVGELEVHTVLTYHCATL